MLASDYLKEKTAANHDAAEAKFYSEKVFDGSFTEEDYYRLLKGNYALTRRLEPIAMEVLQPKFGEALDLESMRKLGALEKDLQPVEGTMPNEPSEKTELSIPEAFGVMYVMEGSMLGGSVMANKLSKNPHLADKEFHYLGIYGKDLGEKWKNFKKVMDEALKEEDFPAALRGADYAYDILMKS